MNKKVRMRGEEIIAKTLGECGIEYLFYMMGAMPTLFPEIENEAVKTVLCRSEMAAAMMADGYSRVTRRPTVCYAQHGAAAAILASMLYEPMYANSPVVALTGSIPTSRKDQWSYQECYEMPYFQSTCKFNVDVTDLDRISEYLRTAIQISVSGCPGPTHVNMHNDMARATAEVPEIHGDITFFKVPPVRPRAESDKVAEAAKLLARSERPVMVCGTGVHLSGAYEELRELAEMLTIPVATNHKGKGYFPEEHPLSVGVVGSYGREMANEVVRESDLVFFVGTRAGSHMTEDLTAPEPGASKIIHLDIDPMAIGRNYRADVALVGDAKATLQDLLAKVKMMTHRPEPKEKRLQEVAKAIRDYENVVNPMMNSDAIAIKPQRVIKEVSKILGPRDIVVSDTGQTLCWTVRLLKQKGTGMNCIPVGGTLGSSFPLAIGVSFGAAEDQRIVNLMGDGGVTYNISELETARRYKDQLSPTVTIVLNNSSLAQTRPSMEDWSKKEAPWIGCCDFTELNYAEISESFGCYGVRVERPGELVEAINEAFDSGKPAIVDVVTDKREYVPIGLSRRFKKEALPGIPVY